MGRPRGTFKLSPAQMDRFRHAYLRGALFRELKEQFDLSTSGVGMYAERLGLPLRRVVVKRAPKPQPTDFPFRWFPPKQPRIHQWRCACTAISTDGPVCSRCRTQEAA